MGARPHTSKEKFNRPIIRATGIIPMLSDIAGQIESIGIAKACQLVKAVALVSKASGKPFSAAEKITLLAKFVEAGDPRTALELSIRAISADKRCIDAWLVGGNSQDRLGMREGARLAFLVVLESPIALPKQKLQASNMLIRYGESDIALREAIRAFDELKQPLSYASEILYVAQKAAAWDVSAKITKMLAETYSKSLFSAAPSSPRTHLNWCSNQAWNLEISKLTALPITASVKHKSVQAQPLADRKLRIGYLSSDFREHPTARLIKGLLRNHDRSRFKVNIFCNGWEDHSLLRKEVLSFSDDIFSISSLGDVRAKQLIMDQKIDVLIDLNGPTRGHRLSLLASRCAPVQIHYLGFPGSLGGGLVDYFVGDPYVTPKECDASFPEKVIRLKTTYQVNDYLNAAPLVPASRTAFGLSESPRLILGMFNAIEKVDFQVWACWMMILRRVPDATLLLLDPGSFASNNIIEATKTCGIDPKRIVFAPRLKQFQHLCRIAMCDLILDPWPYGGHTTTSDALFAGVPVIVKEGHNFASRVSGSLLRAAQLSSLIAKDEEEYVDLAVRLLLNPSKLNELREGLLKKAHELDVFDAASKAKQLEYAYIRAFDLALKGLPPEAIEPT